MLKQNNVMNNEFNLYKEVFEKNHKQVFLKLKQCLKITLGNRVKSISFETGLIYTWLYYYVTLTERESGIGDKIIYSFITDFDQMIKKDREINFNLDSRNLEIKPSFSTSWISKNIIDMLEHQFSDIQKAQKYFEVISRNYPYNFQSVIIIKL